MGWNKSLLTAVAEIKKEFNEDVTSTALYAFKRAQDISPVGNPDLWENPGSAPNGYVGGTFRRAWQLEKKISSGGLLGYLISNPMPYAVPLDEGHSSQAKDGLIDVIIGDLSAFK